MKWLEDIKQFLLPTYCLSCKHPLANKTELFCVSCYDELPRTQHFENKYNDCYLHINTEELPLEYAATLFYFKKDSVLKNSVHLLKYKHKTDVGYFFGIQLGRQAVNVECFLYADYILPLPLHKNKRKIRGYNQSDFIARGVQSILKLPIVDKTVIRIKETKSQTKMNKMERELNMQNAFKWIKEYPEGTHFIVIDDVVTTGASIKSLMQSSKRKYMFSILCIGLSE
ncbi:MAG: ComF family protein [Flavobacteriales bacterium]